MKQFIFSVVFFLCTTLLIGQEYTLSLNLEKGRTYSLYFSNTTISSTIDLSTDNFIFNNEKIDYSATIEFYVDTFKDGVYSMRCSYKTLSMQTTYPQDIGLIDTDGLFDEKNSMIKEVLDKPFIVFMTQQGKIINVENVEEIYLGLITNEIGEVDPLEKHRILFLLKDIFNDENFIATMEVITSILPEKPVSEGDSWKNKSEVKEGNVFHTIKDKFTLEEVSASSITIKSKSTVKQKGFEDEVEDELIEKITFKTKGMTESTIELDAKTRWINRVSYKSTMNGDMNITYKSKKPNKKLPYVISEVGFITN